MASPTFKILSCLFVLLSLASANTLKSNAELRKFCFIFALPGRQNGPDLPTFHRVFNNQLEKVGQSIFGNISHADRMEATKNCSNVMREEQYTPRCAYHRLSTIAEKLTNDVNKLQSTMDGNFEDATYMYITLVTAWYLDRVFLSLDCGPVDRGNLLPVVQWKYVAKWSNHLSTRNKFCTWVKPLSKNVASSMREEVNSICSYRDTEPICILIPVFDLVDSMSNLCDLVPQQSWTTRNQDLNFFIKAAYINFYTMRNTSQMPNDILSVFVDKTSDSSIRTSISDIFTKLYADFKQADLTLGAKLLSVLPKSRYIPCDFNAPFPSYPWLLCSCSKVFEELRVFVKTYETKKTGALSAKFLVADIDYKQYITNMKVSQIKELSEQQAISLDVAVAQIKNNIQDRFNQLGTYFSNVAKFEGAKLNADVGYLKSRIQSYKTKFNDHTNTVKDKVNKLIGFYNGVAAADLHQAIAKMMIRMAKAANPLKWLFGSGNADDIMESATEIATASRLLTQAIRSAVSFKNLVNYNIEISRKLNKNADMIRNVRQIMENAQNMASSDDEIFKKQQTDFIEQYTAYDPQISKDDLAKLENYWELFIEDICEGISSTNSVYANSIRGIGNTGGLCRETKITAAQLVATQEEIYDLQFELMEAMAQLMISLTRIQNSKILGQGSRATNPGGLSDGDIKTLMAVSAMSYTILQTANVYTYCDILEYRRGKKPSLCSGIATNIDRLLALRDIDCVIEHKFISIPTTPITSSSSDMSWLDLGKLLRGESVPFRIPDRHWLVHHGKIFPSEMNRNFYVRGMEIYLPVASRREHRVSVTVSPTNINNKLQDDAVTNYVISPKTDMLSNYAEGQGVSCRLPKFQNPYLVCGRTERQEMPEICPYTTDSTMSQSRPLPSIYSQFDIKVEGYEGNKLDVPVSDIPVKMGIKYCSIDPTRITTRRKSAKPLGTEKERMKRSIGQCCSGTKQLYSESADQCVTCPAGTKSYLNALFCGFSVKILIYTDSLTYNQAATLCTNAGTTIASTALMTEARQLGQKSCICGWRDGSSVDSLTPRNECPDKGACTTNNIHYVYCATKHTL